MEDDLCNSRTPEQKAEYWLARARDMIPKKITTLTQGVGNEDLLNGVCKTFIETTTGSTDENTLIGAKDAINDLIVGFANIRTFATRHSHRILQLVGCNSLWEESDTLSKTVDPIIQWLEDLLCEAMVDPERFSDAFRERRLTFQVGASRTM